jgi:hypothetical protein
MTQPNGANEREENMTTGTISVDQAAAQGRYNPEWVRRLIRQGKIQARKIGRVWFVDIKSFKAYLEQHDR